MMQYLLLPVSVAVWCLIGLLVFIGVREIIKLKPRSTTAEHSKRPEPNTRVVEKNAAMRIYYLAGAGYSGKNEILYAGTTKDSVRRAWERRATDLKPHVEPWAAFEKEARIERIQRRRSPVRSTDWMKKHDEELPVAREA
jgi:hypothetical protein